MTHRLKKKANVGVYVYCGDPKMWAYFNLAWRSESLSFLQVVNNGVARHPDIWYGYLVF